jgi:hypothetical protein
MNFMRKLFNPNWLHCFIATVWMINGLFCKVLNLVPRHQEIVARILTTDNARSLTLIIGIAETGMAAWIVSGIRKRFNAVLQIVLIATMNTIEFIQASDLLLWGRANAIFAFAFILLIYYNEFRVDNKLIHQTACYPS